MSSPLLRNRPGDRSWKISWPPRPALQELHVRRARLGLGLGLSLAAGLPRQPRPCQWRSAARWRRRSTRSSTLRRCGRPWTPGTCCRPTSRQWTSCRRRPAPSCAAPSRAASPGAPTSATGPTRSTSPVGRTTSSTATACCTRSSSRRRGPRRRRTPSSARATCRRTSTSWSVTRERRSCRTSSRVSTAWPAWRAAPSWRPECSPGR
uniref:Uncharacterized protein n=1 Tax=Zea mays TaxID=4577 RepID=C4J3C6_MAIZE|nr:unknown [Zea mays]